MGRYGQCHERYCFVTLTFNLKVTGVHLKVRFWPFLCQLTCQSADIMSSLCGVGVRVRVNNFFSKTTRPRACCFLCQSADIMSSLCGVGVRVRVNNFFSKTTRPRDMPFFLKDTLSIEDEKLFKACKSVCSSVC